MARSTRDSADVSRAYSVLERESANETERRPHARQATERQEREAVREAQGEGDVEGARGEDRELAGRVEPRRQEIAFELVTVELVAGRHDRAEEGRRPQG